MKFPSAIVAALSVAFLVGLKSLAQEAVPVGKGSYASAPPASADPKSRELQSQQLYLVHDDGRPIPTNKWWTQLVVSRFAKSLWSYPLRVDPSEKGLDIY